MRLLGGQPRYRIVERLVETVVAICTGVGERLKVPHREGWLDHRCESRRIRGDHRIVGETAAQAKPGHTKIGILVGHL